MRFPAIVLTAACLGPSAGAQELRLPTVEEVAGALEAVEAALPEALREEVRAEIPALLGELETLLRDELATPEALAALRGTARTLHAQLAAGPATRDFADWLAGRLDYIEVAAEAAARNGRQGAVAPPHGNVTAPEGRAAAHRPGDAYLRDFGVWRGRLAGVAAPVRAATLAPLVGRIFAENGVPAALAWLAEVESSWNPTARSPAGALGLFQFMPATAKSLGLSLFPVDQRTEPAVAAVAAARYLRRLYGRFGNWRLVLAAYNAGETRVARLLSQQGAGGRTFDGIAPRLPLETRMYVPKVMATIARRVGAGALPLPPVAGASENQEGGFAAAAGFF
jgi:membrane-bound lytic murein transglycosylase D